DNYACDRYPGAHVPTSRGACRRPRGPLCQCPYVRAKTAALGAPIFCANTTYFATLRHWHAERLRRRRLLIVDEAHNLEAQLAGVRFFLDDAGEWIMRYPPDPDATLELVPLSVAVMARELFAESAELVVLSSAHLGPKSVLAECFGLDAGGMRAFASPSPFPV